MLKQRLLVTSFALLAMLLLGSVSCQEETSLEETTTVDTTDNENNNETEDDDLNLLREHGALVGSFISILVTEIGDKTFIISAVLATKYSKLWVFIGGYGALFLMTFISCFIGNVSDYFLPEFYIKLIAALLFFIFGGKAIYEGITNKIENEDDEIENDLKELEHKFGNHNDSSPNPDAESDPVGKDKETIELQESLVKKQAIQNQKNAKHNVSHLMVAGQCFAQNFLGEWGDRSQLSTIAMSASFSFWKVFLGSAVGHAVCTYLAVTGGRMLAEKISERTLTLAGGILFVLYGIATLISMA